MPAKNDPAPDLTGDDFVIQRVFDAPRELVFAAWTDPVHLSKWWGPHAFTIPVCQLDLRPGGAYRIVMRHTDGVDYPIKGVFREIIRPQRLVMTMDVSEHPPQWHDLVKPNRAKDDTNPAGELLTTVTFDDLGGKTKLTIRQQFQSKAVADAMKKMGMNEGWSQSLDRLRELLSGTATTDRELRSTRIFDAPREMVFRAWTDPKQIVKWWGPIGFTTTIREMTLKPGGAWIFTMHGPDGADYPNENAYVEIIDCQRLVFDHLGVGPRFRMTVTFDDLGDKTRVDVRILFASAAELEKIEKQYRAGEGLLQTLGRLQDFLAAK